MQYKNYIFDLYGTLADIETDEQEIKLWKKIAKLYGCYGAYYKPKKLRKIFFEMDREERKLLKDKIGCEHPEIKLEKVFLRLLKEYPDARIPENEAVWAEFMANAFRALSRKYIELFQNTLETLDALRKKGCKVYMLSNAQAIFTRPEIKLLELDKHMDRIYISSDYGVMKPDPMFMQCLIETEKIDIKESVMIGNEVRSDIKVADSCGMDAILLNTGRYSKNEIKKDAEANGIKRDFDVISKIEDLLK
ncbi:MAG: HAD family hydrolase [Eubacterium sp.]|nr:HAD family hydrolase [Eubacterium sp.]HCA22083.1 HAD family hydrolase [Lachnospiraceae bacterium]